MSVMLPAAFDVLKESIVKFNKVYIPKCCIERHEDFDTWYEDGALFLRFEGEWSEEKNKIAVMGRMGGEIGHIKPDNRVVNYYLRLERWEYCLHTYTIFKHYYVEGALWDVYGTPSNPPIDFITETAKRDDVRDVHVKLVNFRNKGECYEVRVKNVANLRLAAIATVAMLIKEEWKGLSEGEELPKDAPRLEKWKKRIFSGKGKTYEQVLAEEAALELAEAEE